ncbi:MAG: ribbon-helix-helix protein, CopG family [Atribacterota bacterium]|jgi:metal-responsive CopG/Arc/MetJ family transcriptional regulator|nr:ribbon-helix-helix protein, CopG family [Atribacterota bacterium]MDD3641137.1 ribbon-helix-helix protein, CopG family [Atribacterota bacterium]MDD5636102.1 ribbon-helix-helix protein, CopG family [Atribacterota bacterium]MDI9596238.1 ribbon-helix-helix protein, CopG family [Atribacterota bacterium]
MRKTKIINMSLNEDLYKEVDSLAKERKTSRSQIFKESLISYLDEINRWKEIRKWGEITTNRYNIKSEDDIEKIREEYESDSTS